MTPKRFATEKALELKKECFERYLGTTHWPHWYGILVNCLVRIANFLGYSNIRPASEKPMRGGKVCPKYREEPFEKPELTDTVLKLAGVKAY